MAYDNINFFTEHTNMDYPIGVYYIELEKMFMQHVQWHWHEELEIDFVRSGTALFCIDNETFEVSAGNAILINGHHIHSITSNSPKSCVIVSILFHQNYLFDSEKSFLYLKYCDSLVNNPNFKAIPFYNNTSKGKFAIDSIQAILSTNLTKDFGYELMTKSHLCNFWMYLLKSKEDSRDLPSMQFGIDEERTKKGILFIQDSYGLPLTLDEIADNIHISKSECCRCFKRSIGLSPFEYLMQYRIFASAVKMQRTTQEKDSIAILSESCGFNNASYYNKIFKKYVGCTPTQYRDQIKTSHRDSLSPYGIPLTRM